MQGGHRVRKKGLGFQEKELSSALERLDKEINDFIIMF
jgi:hypothetical protein